MTFRIYRHTLVNIAITGKTYHQGKNEEEKSSTKSGNVGSDK